MPHLTTLERIILDPISEGAANAPLEITGREAGAGVYLVEHAYPKAERKTTFAGNRSTLGERKIGPGLPGNRIIPVKAWVAEEQGIGAATNLMPNPSSELTAGAAGYNGGAASRVTEQAHDGEYSMKIVTPGVTIGAGGEGSGNSGTLGPGTTYAVIAASTAYVGALWVRAPLGALLTMNVDQFTAAPVFITSAPVNFVGTGEWQRVSVAFTSAGTAARACFSVRTRTSIQAITWYEDGYLLGLASQLATIDHFDGDTPGCSWSGVPHASTSLRKAAGGKRFIGALNDLEAKIEKMAREQGTYKRVLPSGDSIVFDVLDASIDTATARAAFNQGRGEVDLEFVCAPLGRGPEVTIGADTTVTGAPASSPVLTATLPSAAVKGSYGARGRLLLDNDVAFDQAFLAWGIESRYFDTADPATKKLLLDSSDITNIGSATKVAGPTGAFGAGSNVIRETSLGSSPAAFASTQLTGGGSHLEHVGTFRVWARVYRPASNAGEVSVWLEWAQGDFRSYQANRKKTWAVDEAEAIWQFVPLGVVKIPPAIRGTQKWEGRLVGSSTADGDEIDLDYLWLQPVAEGAGRVTALPSAQSPTSFIVQDGFNRNAVALTGASPNRGSAWAVVTSSDVDDYSTIVSGGSSYLQRIVFGDTTLNRGRLVSVGAASYAAIRAKARINMATTPPTPGSIQTGMFARLADIDNHVRVVLTTVGGLAVVKLQKVILGAPTDLAAVVVGPSYTVSLEREIEFEITASGLWRLWIGGYLVGSGYDGQLATGGTLATGRFGVLDVNTAASGVVQRRMEALSAWAPVADAAIFASQSAEIRHDSALREDLGGTIWTEISGYRGDHILIPPAGREKRGLRWTAKLSRSDPEQADLALDACSGQLFATPLYDTVPEPS